MTQNELDEKTHGDTQNDTDRTQLHVVSPNMDGTYRVPPHESLCPSDDSSHTTTQTKHQNCVYQGAQRLVT